MKIAYIVKRFPVRSETFIAQEILELERRGVEVLILSLKRTDSPARHAWLRSLRAPVVFVERQSLSVTWDGLARRLARGEMDATGLRDAITLALVHAGEEGRRHLAYAAALAEVASAHGVSHLHAHFANRPAFTALLSHLLSGLSFSFTAHAKDIYAEGPSVVLWRELLARAEFAVTVSEANRRHLLALLDGECEDRLRCLYNGVDLEAIRPVPAMPNHQPPFRVLAVARLVPKKGIDLLLEATARLLDAGVDLSLTIVGDGPRASDLRARRESLGLDSRVRFTGALEHQEVMARLHASDLFVLPCRVAEDGDQDALPTVLLEAMAAGVPSISTPVGGVGEIVVDGETGLLVASDDIEGLAQAMADLLHDPGRRQSMAAAARRRAEELFDRRRNVPVLEGWFRDAVSRSAASRAVAEAAR